MAHPILQNSHNIDITDQKMITFITLEIRMNFSGIISCSILLVLMTIVFAISYIALVTKKCIEIDVGNLSINGYI